MRIPVDHKILADRHPEEVRRLVARLPRARDGGDANPRSFDWFYEYHLPFGKERVEARIDLKVAAYSGRRSILQKIEADPLPPEVHETLYPPVVTEENFDHFARVVDPGGRIFLIFDAYYGQAGTKFVARAVGDPKDSLRLPPYEIRVTGGGDIEYLQPIDPDLYERLKRLPPGETLGRGQRRGTRMSRAQAIAAVQDVASWVAEVE